MDILKDFFNLNFEKEFNNKMQYYDYEFEFDKVYDYVLKLINIPLVEFHNYIIKNSISYIAANDVIQFSNFEDCTINICSKIKKVNDPGLKFLEIGKILEDDGIIRKNGAYLKYGENHSKTAEQLGLLHSLNKTYYLSCLGFILPSLNHEEYEKLIKRLILRNKLIRRFISFCSNGKTNYFDVVNFLKPSTAIRRKSNVKFLIKYLTDNDENYLFNLDKLKI